MKALRGKAGRGGKFFEIFTFFLAGKGAIPYVEFAILLRRPVRHSLGDGGRLRRTGFPMLRLRSAQVSHFRFQGRGVIRFTTEPFDRLTALSMVDVARSHGGLVLVIVLVLVLDAVR